MSNESWHLSKSVPLSLIAAIAAQTLGMVWYISSLDSNVETNAREIARHEVRIQAIEKTAQDQAVMLARIDENLNAIRDIVERMASKQR
jgi:Tfp pilus assembly protein PilO